MLEFFKISISGNPTIFTTHFFEIDEDPKEYGAEIKYYFRIVKNLNF
jgi:hypothetical protein